MRVVVDLERLASPQALASSASRPHAARSSKPLPAWPQSWGRRLRRLLDIPERICILVTKESACLYDLVLRQKQGDLPCEIAFIVSNHPTLEPVAESFRIPFYTLPVSKDTKAEQERRVLDLCKKHHVSLVVLARYMQVLSDEFLTAAPPVINIHHGFLPAFQGAKPYH